MDTAGGNCYAFAMHSLVATSLFRLTVTAAVFGGVLIVAVSGWLLARRTPAGRAWLQARADGFRAWRQELRREMVEPGSRYLWAMLGALVVPAWLLLRYPPFFNASDAVSMYSWSLASHMPHWQPLYLVFLRSINLVVEGTFNFKLEAPVSMMSVYVALLLQHAAMVGATGLFGAVATQGRRRAFVLALSLGLLTGAPVYAHSVFFSVFVLVAVLLLITACILVVRAGRVTALAALLVFVAILLAMLIRHDGIVLIFLLPLSALAAGLLNCAGWRPLLRGMAVSVGAAAVALLLTALCQWVLATPVSSVYGRSGITFLATLYQPEGYAPASEVREKLLPLGRTPLEQKTFELAPRYGRNWSHLHPLLRDWMRQQGKERKGIKGDVMPEYWPEVDEAINTIYRTYVANYPVRYARQVLTGWSNYLFCDQTGKVLAPAFTPPSSSVMFLDRAAKSPLFRESRIVRIEPAAYERALNDPVFLVCGLFTPWRLAVVCAVLLGWCLWSRRRRCGAAVPLALCVSSAGYLLFLALASANTPERLTMPAMVMLGAAVVLLVGRLSRP